MAGKVLNPNTPGGLLTEISGLLTANEELVIQAITAGTYFYYNTVPSGTVDSSNVTFTLSATPNPVASLRLLKNGQLLKAGGVDFTLSGATITMVIPPDSGDLLLAHFTVSPV